MDGWSFAIDKPRYLSFGLLQVLLKDKMNVLLLLLPFAIISKAVGWTAGVTFILSLLPLCSLAEVREAGTCCSCYTVATCQKWHCMQTSRKATDRDDNLHSPSTITPVCHACIDC